MSPLVQHDDDFLVPDFDGRGDVQEVAEDLLGRRLLIFAADLVGEQTIQRAGHERDLQVEVDLHADHRRQGVEVKELHGLGDAVFDQHALRVARHQRRAAAMLVVGQEDRRFLMTEIDHGDLA